MITPRHTQTLRLLIILGICLATALSLAIYTQRHALFTTMAHAAASTTCAATKGRQQAYCEHQDPIQQGCVTDAETLDLHTVFQKGQPQKPLGEVELRYSPTCKTYWVRTTAFITSKGTITTMHAILLFHNHTKEDIAATPTFPDPRIPAIAWTDMTTAPLLQHAASGSFDMVGQPHPLTISLKA